MDTRPKKRSLTLKGHRTSVTLEDDFWRAFRAIASEKSVAVNTLAAEIDAERGTESGLATAIRLYVLRHFQAIANDQTQPQAQAS
ncbi:ribbon-helix-helix domain-containing protein [Rhodobacteraceae bacterium MYP1-1]|uniref:Ribbon-helix-helix domain-containing protein n=1 Tax=Halocynthiibacter styelae TaxID=2761955 RepID=A0A8J7IDW5_9RHOB|nr:MULTISPECIES: ribbon-helix-helix domain-containing protein [Rhodobacterales]MBI1494189.1 ribbon-helix-helix domain-containing protein [Paenihalocynthiibacter styelae]